jgi:hypothetical protein
MDSGPQRQMSTTEIDLESVLQVRRRRLSVTTPQASQDSHRYTDVIILKVEKSNDILKEDSRCIFHGLYFLLSIEKCSMKSSRRLSCLIGYISKIYITY